MLIVERTSATFAIADVDVDGVFVRLTICFWFRSNADRARLLTGSRLLAAIARRRRWVRFDEIGGV